MMKLTNSWFFVDTKGCIKFFDLNKLLSTLPPLHVEIIGREDKSYSLTFNRGKQCQDEKS